MLAEILKEGASVKFNLFDNAIDSFASGIKYLQSDDLFNSVGFRYLKLSVNSIQNLAEI